MNFREGGDVSRALFAYLVIAVVAWAGTACAPDDPSTTPSTSVSSPGASASDGVKPVPLRCSRLDIIAHRGYHPSGIAENTLQAFALAAARGYDIESDVRADADGRLWVFHDRNMRRATGRDADIDKLNTSEVAATRYRKGNGEIPTLEQALALWKTFPNTTIYLEPKTTRIAERAATMVREAGLLNRVVLTDYSLGLRSAQPDLLLMQKSFRAVPDPQVMVDNGADIGAFRPIQLTPDTVRAYHQAGLEVQTKNVNDARSWRALITSGGDGVLTDRPDQVREFCPDAGRAPDVSVSASPVGPGDVVILEGEAFYQVSSVQVGDVPATFRVLSATRITLVVPPEADSGRVRVTTPAGEGRSARRLRVR